MIFGALIGLAIITCSYALVRTALWLYYGGTA
jgi:hypothetical protein